jgi:hypothetical protein
MADLKETRKLVEALSKLSNEVVSIAIDGKLDYTDIPDVVLALKELAEVSGCDFGAVKAELESINQGDEQQINDVIREAFDIENDDVECKIEAFIFTLVDWILSSKKAAEALLVLKAALSQ